MRLSRHVRIRVIFNQSILAISLFAEDPKAIGYSHCGATNDPSDQRCCMELHWSISGSQNSWHYTDEHWWLGVFHRNISTHIHRHRYTILEVPIPLTNYHSHRSRFPIHCLKCKLPRLPLSLITNHHHQLFVNKHMSSQAALGAGVLQTAMRLSISLGLAISTAVFGAVQNAQTPNLMLTDPRTTLPYHRALLCASMFAAVGLLFIPFMRINTKAVSPPPLPTFPPTFIEPALHALDPLQEDRDPEKKPGNQSQRNDKDIPNSDFSQGPNGKVSEYPFYHTKHTNSSFQSAYTYDSASTTGKHEVSFFPRWSWEDSNGSGGPVGFDDSVQGAFWPKVLDARQRGRKRNGHGMRGKLGNGNVFSRSRVEEDIVLYEVCVNCLQERRVLLRGGESSFGFGFGLGDGRDLLHPPDAHTRGRNRRT